MRLIDADALLEKMQECKESREYRLLPLRIIEWFIAIIHKAPTIDVKPVVHGEWKTEFDVFFPVYRCSECNCATALGKTKFCPNCGADMRKKEG